MPIEIKKRKRAVNVSYEDLDEALFKLTRTTDYWCCYPSQIINRDNYAIIIIDIDGHYPHMDWKLEDLISKFQKNDNWKEFHL